MKILVCISNYGNHQLEYLREVIQEYNRMASDGLSVDIIIDTTVPIDFGQVSNRLNIAQQMHDPTIGKGLVFAHRPHVIERYDSYDLFIYTENDILITLKNIKAFLNISHQIPGNYITGFLRYEIKQEDKKKYLIDAHPQRPIILQNTININGIDYISLANFHQGGWILTRRQLKQVLNSGGFFTAPHRSKKFTQVYDTLESGATDIYTLCGFAAKLLPVGELSSLMVHHLPNKYVNSGGEWENPGPLTLDQLKGLLNPHGKSIRIECVNPEKFLQSASRALENKDLPLAERILKKGIRYCPQFSELFRAYNLLKKKNVKKKWDQTESETPSDNVLYLGMAPGENFGWGVCSQYLIKELALKRQIQVLNGNPDSRGDINLPGKLFKTLINKEFVSLYEADWGRENYGYTFFENELNLQSIENARKYDMVLAGSTWCRNRLLEKGINNCGLLIQGVDPEKFFPITAEKSQDNFVVFSGGKFELRKGQDMVLKAIKILQEKYADIILINAWQNLWPESVNSMATSPYIKFEFRKGPWSEVMNHIYRINGLDPQRIVTLDLVPGDKLRQIYKQTDLGIFPNRCEGGTNLVLMEYMACGKPVIVSNTSGHRDIVTETNALLLNDLTPINIVDANKELTARWKDPSLDELIAGIEYAYHNREEIQKIGAAAGRDLNAFTWKNCAQKLLEALED